MLFTNSLGFVKWRPISYRQATRSRGFCGLGLYEKETRRLGDCGVSVFGRTRRIAAAKKAQFKTLSYHPTTTTTRNCHTKRTMTTTTSAREHPILSQLLSSNEQWSIDVEKVQPGFFAQISKGQAPQVCPSPPSSKKSSIRANTGIGIMVRLLRLSCSRKCLVCCPAWRDFRH